MNSRFIKIGFSCAVGLYITLVCFNNVVDTGSNFPFVRMVTTMEDTFSKGKNGWRSIQSPLLQYLLFSLIVIWEFSISIFLWLGAYKMIRALKTPADVFRTAKKPTAVGLFLGILLWFVVFISIGGEWFLMWQSKTWNAQPTAFFLTCCFLLFLIHHNQEDR